MKSIPRTRFGKYSILLLFFILAPLAHAQEYGATTTLYTFDGNTVRNINSANTRQGAITCMASSSDFYIDNVSAEMHRTAVSSGGSVYGIVGTMKWQNRSPDFYLLATSTNSITVSSITTNAGAPVWYEFVFASNTLATTSKDFAYYSGDGLVIDPVCVGIWFDTPGTATNNVSLRYTTGGNSLTLPTTHEIGNTYERTATRQDRYSWRINGAYVNYDTGGGGGGDCPDGYECYTLEEMASTTEAIYTVGQVMQIYVGIFLLAMFGAIAYVFTKKFL